MPFDYPDHADIDPDDSAASISQHLTKLHTEL